MAKKGSAIPEDGIKSAQKEMQTYLKNVRLNALKAMKADILDWPLIMSALEEESAITPEEIPLRVRIEIVTIFIKQRAMSAGRSGEKLTHKESVLRNVNKIFESVKDVPDFLTFINVIKHIFIREGNRTPQCMEVVNSFITKHDLRGIM